MPSSWLRWNFRRNPGLNGARFRERNQSNEDEVMFTFWDRCRSMRRRMAKRQGTLGGVLLALFLAASGVVQYNQAQQLKEYAEEMRNLRMAVNRLITELRLEQDKREFEKSP